MAECCGYQDGTPKAASGSQKFLHGLAVALLLWGVLVGALILV